MKNLENENVNVEAVEVEVIENEVVEETKWSKVKGFVAKRGKKLLAVATAVTAGALVYELGRNKGHRDNIAIFESFELPAADDEDEIVEEFDNVETSTEEV